MDYERLRRDLIEYFGSAMLAGSPMAVIELIDIEYASNKQLIKYANVAGFNLSNY